MQIPCLRCDKKLDTPDASNADYIMAGDTVVKEPREVLIALKHNQTTLKKVEDIVRQWRIEEAEKRNLELGELELNQRPTPDFILSKFQDSEYDSIEVSNVSTAMNSLGEDLVKVVVKIKDEDVQKTGIICPDCYKPTDFVIWGVHKK